MANLSLYAEIASNYQYILWAVILSACSFFEPLDPISLEDLSFISAPSSTCKSPSPSH